MNDAQRNTHPGGAPMWENVEKGKLQATIVMHKKSPLFKTGKPPSDVIIGNPEDREAMEAHVAKTLAWLEHYDTYYGVTGWKYEVKWKG